MTRFVLTIIAASLSSAALIHSPPAAAAPDQGVVLINVFETKAGREQECLAMWQRAADFLKTKAGFRATALHESVGPDARFKFVNVAVWDTPQAFRAAVSDPDFRALAATDACTANPALYKVVSVGKPAHE